MLNCVTANLFNKFDPDIDRKYRLSARVRVSSSILELRIASANISKKRLTSKRNLYYKVANAKIQEFVQILDPGSEYFVANVPWMIIGNAPPESHMYATPNASKVRKLIEVNPDVATMVSFGGAIRRTSCPWEGSSGFCYYLHSRRPFLFQLFF